VASSNPTNTRASSCPSSSSAVWNACSSTGGRKRRPRCCKHRPQLTEKELARLVKDLELNPKQCPFSNKTGWTLRAVYEEDHALLEQNFRAYINGFSANVDDIIEHFNYRATIGLMVKNNRLAPILNQYKELPLGPGELSGPGDGLHLRGTAAALLGAER
jgi:hypothetical protein